MIVVFQKFNGLALNGGIYFNASNINGFNYVPTAVYVGVIAVVLAAWRWSPSAAGRPSWPSGPWWWSVAVWSI